jgi:hypothetical protein
MDIGQLRAGDEQTTWIMDVTDPFQTFGKVCEFPKAAV